MARIGIDAIQVAPAGKGHARSQRRLVESLAALGDGHELTAFARSEDGAALLRGSGVRVERIRERHFLAWELWGMPRAARRLRLDAVVTLTDRLAAWGGTRFVVWLFELPTHRIAENRRSGAGAYQRGSDLLTAALWRPSLRRAARVVAGSQATASELEAALPELRGSVRVVYPGLDAGFGQVPGPGPEPRPERPGRYVFHLASADPRDNTETVVRAFHAVRAAAREPVRLIVGGNVGTRRLEGEGIEVAGYVADEDLVRLYSGAAAYADATLYEGFGYQPLEAMACGAPVVASRASSVPEVVGDAGLLCDPRSETELAAALLRVLEEPGLADELRRRGRARAREFTWERTAREFAAILAEVTSS
ncbi:MAG: glycosyltransferase family 4 protein [Gaiellaceae bacterium]